MGFFDAFFGTTQSQYAAYAIIAAIVAICITILLSGTDVPIGNRFLIVLFVIISLIPSIFLMLFELTCIVTGGTSTERWWCWLFAWVIAAFIIIYCVFIVIISFVSLFTYNNAINKVIVSDNENKMTPQNSNNYAKTIIENNDKIEKFMAEQQENNFNNSLNEAYNNLTNSSDSVNSPVAQASSSQPVESVSASLPTPPIIETPVAKKDASGQVFAPAERQIVKPSDSPPDMPKQNSPVMPSSNSPADSTVIQSFTNPELENFYGLSDTVGDTLNSGVHGVSNLFGGVIDGSFGNYAKF